VLSIVSHNSLNLTA